MQEKSPMQHMKDTIQADQFNIFKIFIFKVKRGKYMDKKIKVNSFYRVGIVVKDIDQKMAIFRKYFDFDESKVITLDCSQNNPTFTKHTYMGKDSDFGMKICIFPLGNIEMELIQPLEEAGGPYSDFLKEHGEGIHHLNIDVENMDIFYEAMEQIGGTFLTGGEVENLKYKYYDVQKAVGMILEGCENIN